MLKSINTCSSAAGAMPICRAEHSQLSEQLVSGRQAFGIPGEHGGLADVVQPQVQHGYSLQP